MAPAAQSRPTPPGVRMPKLTYRNPLPPDQLSVASSVASSVTSSVVSSSNSSSDHISFALPPSRMSASSSAGSSSRASSSPRASYDSHNAKSSSVASSGASASTCSKGTKKKKKKSNPVFGFLTLKEPSQAAFQQFAEQQRKQDKDKSAAKSASSASSFTSSSMSVKLPPEVPKVNTKWNGLPEKPDASHLRPRTRDSFSTWSTPSSASQRFPSMPTTSVFSLASHISRGAPNSLASAAASVTSIPSTVCTYDPRDDPRDDRRDSGPSLTISDKGTSPSTTTLPEISFFFPAGPNTDSSLSTTHQNVAVPRSSLSSSADSTRPQQPSTHPTNLVFEGSSSSTMPVADIDVNLRELLGRASAASGFLAGEAQPVDFPDEGDSMAESEVTVFDQSDTLMEKFVLTTTSPLPSPLPSPSFAKFPQASAKNFSRPLSTQSLPATPDTPLTPTFITPPVKDMKRLSLGASANKAVTEMPTLYEDEGSSSSTETIACLPEARERRNSDAGSVTGSVMSASWYQSSRERLGLGGRIRKSDVLPWESAADAPGRKKKGRMSMFAAKGTP
ncbi:hypothetical protein EJ04DRAFT_354080 [Polyplosphaeria fusca]|uniref:Uncharacterized protein n=1 Tax=Polyplosphaeria fusca TaxID=682080 RepID=A0A9P4V438_9PLEO|nr:hypothetical protein EJ04DRAFT_354080 [Polyplosphaeria fusca]